MHNKCKKGLDSMTEQAKQARRAYKKEWARNHRDQVRATQARYWERKAAQAEKAQQEPQKAPTQR